MMKTAPAIAAFMVLVSLMVGGCGRPSVVTTPSAETQPAESPTYQALAAGAFIDPAIPRITAADLKSRLGSAVIVVDNRSEYKFKEGHLAGAINITYSVNSPYPGAEEEMDRDLARLPNDALKVFYCD
jgi:hypothetical protein